MAFSPFLPSVEHLQDLIDTFAMRMVDYIDWRSRLTQLRQSAEDLQRSIRPALLASGPTLKGPSGLTDDEHRAYLMIIRTLQHAFDLANTAAETTVKYEEGADEVDRSRRAFLLLGLILDPQARPELPDYQAAVLDQLQTAYPFAALRQDADDLFTLIELICDDDQIDYGLWKETLDHLQARRDKLLQRAVKLENPRTWSDISPDMDRKCVLFSLVAADDIKRRAEAAIEHFRRRRKWLTAAHSLLDGMPILPCLASQQQPRFGEERIERLWLRRWAVGEAYSGLSLGSIYAREAMSIDLLRGSELPDMGLYNCGATQACDIIKRQSGLNIQRLRRYFRMAPLDDDEKAFLLVLESSFDRNSRRWM